MMQINRIMPAMAPDAYQTYHIDSPLDVMIRSVCEDVGCPAFTNGWETTVDESSELGKLQAQYIRTRSDRTFREMRSGAFGTLTVFRFDSGQRCFADHETRPETYLMIPGDWRQQTGPERRHGSAQSWVEDFAEHQERLVEEVNRG